MFNLFDKRDFRRGFFLAWFRPHVVDPSAAFLFTDLIHYGKKQLAGGVGKIDQVFAVEFVLNGVHSHDTFLIMDPYIGARKNEICIRTLKRQKGCLTFLPQKFTGFIDLFFNQSSC